MNTFFAGFFNFYRSWKNSAAQPDNPRIPDFLPQLRRGSIAPVPHWLQRFPLVQSIGLDHDTETFQTGRMAYWPPRQGLDGAGSRCVYTASPRMAAQANSLTFEYGLSNAYISLCLRS